MSTDATQMPQPMMVDWPPPLHLEVPLAPTPFQADDRRHLVYELHVTNFGQQAQHLTQVDVLREGENPGIVQLTGAELTASFALAQEPRQQSPDQQLAPGARAVIFLWLSFETPAEIPTRLRHQVHVTAPEAGETAGPRMVAGADVAVEEKPPVTLGPPLRGANWLAVNGPSNRSRHRRALLAVGGRATIAQRFATDWVQVGANGRTWAETPADNASYHAHGAEVLAGADGTVAAIKDGIPENVPDPAARAVPMTLENVSGNYVVIDLGAGRYAFYAHLQPGSLRVQPGDAVQCGQVIGLLGNSGNSTEPHLHFHVSNGSEPLATEGRPYLLSAFTQRPIQVDGTGQVSVGAETAHESALPREMALVSFAANG